ncbi:hypothetical protein EDD73_10175 [Heliophilum fasciatum]|uniref:Uncharacterized protein n=1 Tax=Heliophilum fasciatum TaxID=35700 RepID=A0A4R2S0G3_9FIRM|nr:hypothetical protein [Heliophilum fasciatum]TCP68909.1 hypothetical protein EDD73_10175 [Heliophilum fasciatum]
MIACGYGDEGPVDKVDNLVDNPVSLGLRLWKTLWKHEYLVE